MQTTRELRVQPELSRRMEINPVTCDLHRQHGGIRGWSALSQRRGRAGTCCCNSWAPQVPRICLDFFFFSFSPFFFLPWFKPANPDQTVILIGEKHPGSTFECLWSQLLSMTDRQQHVRRASFDIMFRSAYQHKSVVNRSPSLQLFIYLFQISCSWPLTSP